MLLLALATLVAGACAGQKTPAELAKENGATVIVTLDLAGGTSDGQTARYLYVRENAPIVLPWDAAKDVIYAPSNSGKRLEGFYHGTKDGETGEITYGDRWDPRERFTEDTTLYARWSPPFVFRIIDGEGNLVKDFTVDPGDQFDSRDSAAATVEGRTFIAYYSDAACTIPWNTETVHPGYPEGVNIDNATDEDYVYTVYAKYVDGEFKKVYTAKDFRAASNYWLIGDENGVIDFEGTAFPVIRQFVGKVVGNGVTVKNAVLTRENAVESDIGFFGKLVGATISDVTFENCSLEVTFTRRPQGVSVARVGFLAGSAENTTLENVTFSGCSVKLGIAQGSNGNPVVPCEYEESESCLWFDRASDAAKGNTLSNVQGNVILNII